MLIDYLVLDLGKERNDDTYESKLSEFFIQNSFKMPEIKLKSIVNLLNVLSRLFDVHLYLIFLGSLFVISHVVNLPQHMKYFSVFYTHFKYLEGL